MQVAGAWRCRQCVTGAHSVRLCTNASPDRKPVQPVQVHVYPVTTALFWLLSACCWQLSDDDMPRNGVKYSRRHAKLMYCIDGGHNRAEICVRFWLTSCHAHRVYIYTQSAVDACFVSGVYCGFVHVLVTLNPYFLLSLSFSKNSIIHYCSFQSCTRKKNV